MRASVGGADTVTWGTPAARWILLATVLGSGVAFLDATVVNVALPTIGTELDASVAGLQWILNGYTLTLASLMLIGGSLGDRFGRRRVFLAGIVWFAAATLVAAPALQGVGGALLTPGSLAIIQAWFAPRDRARAVGAWSGLSGIAAAIGPFAGGWLIGVGSWRLIFLINVPLAVAVVAVAIRHVPETRDPLSVRGIDVAGDSALRCFSEHLSEGGIILVEPWFTPENWRAGHVAMSPPVDRPEIKLCRMSVAGRQGDVSLIRFHYLIAKSGGVDYLQEEHALGLYSVDDMLEFFGRAGLTTRYEPEGFVGRGLYVARRAA